ALRQSCGAADDDVGLHFSRNAAMFAILALLTALLAMVATLEELMVTSPVIDVKAPRWAISTAKGTIWTGPGPVPSRPSTVFAGSVGGTWARTVDAAPSQPRSGTAKRRARSNPVMPGTVRGPGGRP